MNRGRRRGARRGTVVLVALALAAAAALLHHSAEAVPGSRPAEGGAPTGTSAETIGALVAADTSAPTPYERDKFGQRWADVDRTGCDQRNDRLSEDLVDVVYRAGTHNCVVERGTLTDPYTGKLIHFEKAAGGVDIDHVVPLAAAWQAGAWSWTEQRRTEFANDLSDLQATSSSVNRSKGDQSIDEWLPPDQAYMCTYVTRWVPVSYTHLTLPTNREV